RIFRVMRGLRKDGQEKQVAYLSGPYAPALQNDFEGRIESTLRVTPNVNLISFGDQSFYEKKVLNADSNFFSFFSYPLIIGNPNTALKNSGSVVLSETTAIKYFGTKENAFGKTVMLDKDTPLEVTGVMKDVPANSHLD